MMKYIITYILFLIPACALSSDINDKNDVRKIALPGTIALTFDDGPNPTFTPQILAILKKYHVKATFFVVGREAESHPELIKMIHDQGHVVAIHSQTHPNLTKISDAQLQNEVEKPREIIINILGAEYAPKCLRYPFNASNQHVRDVIHEHGMIPVTVGRNAYDYKKPGVDKIVSNVLSTIHQQEVIVMHDGFADREQTVAALPKIIEGIQTKKLGFSTICG